MTVRTVLRLKVLISRNYSGTSNVKSSLYCAYYHARIEPQHVWFFVGVLKSYDHLGFDRTLDKQTSTFEFFVPESSVPEFEALVHRFVADRVMSDVKRLPNRLALPDQAV